MSWLVIAGIAVGALVLFVLVYVFASGERWSRSAGTMQALITTAGILTAGYLYLVERRGQPHADVSQAVEAVSLPDQNVLIQASVTVKNLGTQLLLINQIRSSLKVMDLEALGLPELPTAANADYWNATSTVRGKTAPAFLETEIEWPQRRLYDEVVHHEVEPGESDLLTVDFIIPCMKARYVRVATDVEKRPPDDAKDEARNMVWKTRTLVDLKPACEKGP